MKSLKVYVSNVFVSYCTAKIIGGDKRNENLNVAAIKRCFHGWTKKAFFMLNLFQARYSVVFI